MGKKLIKYEQYPNGLKAFSHTKATIFDLMVYFLAEKKRDDSAAISDRNIDGLAMEFERLNFRSKWKPDSQEWEAHIYNFCDIKTNYLR
jgi:hypothetical protein